MVAFNLKLHYSGRIPATKVIEDLRNASIGMKDLAVLLPEAFPVAMFRDIFPGGDVLAVVV